MPDRRCPFCHSPLPDAASFCPSCGASTPAQQVGSDAGDQLARLRSAIADRVVFR